MNIAKLGFSLILGFFIVQCGDLPTTALKSTVQQTSSPYYRFWRGWKKPDVQNFHSVLANDFIPAAPRTHAQNGLEAYLVATPPEDHADFIPDEYALVIYRTESVYQKAKNTPEGIAYAESHWNIFDKENSASLVPENYPDLGKKTIELGKAYDVLARPVDWQRGYTTFFVGLRKSDVSLKKFSQRLTHHVDLVAKTFATKGLLAYVLMASDQYEIAYQNWSSKEAFEQAMKAHGATVQKDAEQFMELQMFQAARDFDDHIGPNDFVNVKFDRP